jgi:XTP/dITP diphosphohydrolase
MALGRVVLASGNAGKLSEMRALLAATGIELVSQRELGVPDVPEPHPTFVENALTKARHASRFTGSPALADDSGVCVPSLHGAPGVRSARYAAAGDASATDAQNNAKLVAQLEAQADRSAYYYCALVLVREPEDPQPVIADAIWHGEIIAQPRGSGGFGYDPHFLLPALGLTAAELSAEHKNRISHRGLAMRALLERLREARLIT